MVKVTFYLDQPLLGEHTEKVVKEILSCGSNFGAYQSFDPAKVKVEEIKDGIDPDEMKAFIAGFKAAKSIAKQDGAEDKQEEPLTLAESLSVNIEYQEWKKRYPDQV